MMIESGGTKPNETLGHGGIEDTEKYQFDIFVFSVLSDSVAKPAFFGAPRVNVDGLAGAGGRREEASGVLAGAGRWLAEARDVLGGADIGSISRVITPMRSTNNAAC
ncbi:hypothetical protein BH09PLA1_BH09PLA1_00810 [soil metagenome]